MSTTLRIIRNSAYWKLCRIRHSFHAAEYLKDAFDAAYGADDPKATAQFEKYRHLLLRHLRSKHPRNERVAQALGYFRNNQHRMDYAEAKNKGLPIGSGVVEATARPWDDRAAQALGDAME